MTQDTAYKANPLIKQRGVVVNYTKEQVQELIRCEQDPVYFCEKYIKVISLDHGIIPYKPYPFQYDILNSLHDNRFTICKLPRQPLDIRTPVPTPSGWSTIENISIGDFVYDHDGNQTKVIDKTDIMYNHDCYKIYFDNGDEIISSGNHQWEISSSYWNHKIKVLSSENIYQNYKNKPINKRGVGVAGSYYINSAKSLKCQATDLPIDPYTLGIWLGDGTSRTGQVTAHRDDFNFYKTKLDVACENKSKSDSVVTFRINGLFKLLKENNLIQNKHIPTEYLRASYSDRLELLRGLMDTDGTVRKNTKSYEFFQKNYDLINQVKDLLSTLGIKSRIRYKLINGVRYHTISFTTKERVVNLPRKIKSVNNHKPDRPHNHRHYIHRIEKVDSVPVACITVEHDRHLFLCGDSYIPTHNCGKSVTVTAYIIHQVIFRDNINVAILANKRETAFELMEKLQTSYENLPKWMQQGVLSWNKGSIELENGSRVLASATSASAVRGFSYNIVVLDEFAHVASNVADEFFTSVYPTISSGKTTKVIIVSTPKGLNHFYKLWTDAEKGRNSYNAVEAHWSAVPGRDEKWKEETIANTSPTQFAQEFECDFMGSVGTLINTSKLKDLVYEEPLISSGGLDVYEKAKKDHEYIMTVDVSHGMSKDYSAFIVVDVTSYPHKMVAKYRDNKIKPMTFPNVIVKVAKEYNKAWILCEINDIGEQVASIIFYDIEYQNLLMTSMRGRAGQCLGHGFSGGKTQLGLKMAKAPKKLGCSNLKQIIESDKLIFNDYQTITELTTFIEKRSSFEADDGCNDDLVMCLVIYAWAVAQQYFKEMTSQDVREQLYEKDKDSLEEDMSPFGFISTSDDDIVPDKYGNIWEPVEDGADEYGSAMSPWRYHENDTVQFDSGWWSERTEIYSNGSN